MNVDEYGAADDSDLDRLLSKTSAGRPGANYACRFCRSPIVFSNRLPFNADGSAHRCVAKMRKEQKNVEAAEDVQKSTLFAMAAMNAIVSGQLQAGGFDYLGNMNFEEVADAAWGLATAMLRAEKSRRTESGGAF